MKIVVIASLAWSLVNFRGELLRRMAAEGHRVTAIAPDLDPDVVAALAARGVAFRQVPMDRTGRNPLADVATLRALVRLLREIAPDVVLAYTQKPIVYGGLASRIARRGRFFAMVSGLGHAFSDGGGWRRGFLRRVVALLYARALARAAGVFVFNGDDEREMRRHGMLGGQRVVQLPGSGIDTRHFAAQPVPPGPPVFVMIARLMRDKGLHEFVAAAAIIRARDPAVRFRLLGPLDRNPTGITRAQVDAWVASGAVEYLGETRDVRRHLSAASVFVLPSFYREGLPRTILEAMAVGRAIITTDMPGCREPVEHGRNGFLVPPRDGRALAQAMQRFLDDPALATRMGERSRRMAEERYDVDHVNDRLIAEMGLSRDAVPPTPASIPARSRASLGERPFLELPLALGLAIATLPLAIAVGLVVLLALGRPILFEQRRAGLGGRTFTMRKFRTMRNALDENGRPLPDAARLTRTGRVLRRTRLDELPELWNVLRRDMALIGPRPLLPETVAAMGEGGRVRGAVRPGLTGWAQVNGNVLLTDTDKLALDRFYIAHRSLALDLRIVLRTLPMLVGGDRIDNRQIERAYAGIADRRG